MKFILGLSHLPFSPVEEQIIYVEGEYNEDTNRYIQQNYDSISALFRENEYEFVYIPRLKEDIKNTEILKYNAPYADKVGNVMDIDSTFMLNYMAHPENRKNIPPSLIFYNERKFIEDYSEAKIQYQGISLPLGTELERTNCLSDLVDDINNEYLSGILFRRGSDEGILKADNSRLTPNINYDEDEEVKYLLEEMKSIANRLRLKGVSEYVLEETLHSDEKLSRLHITSDYRILLPDYDNMEIKMAPLPKIVFLLYLNHPEGITFKKLSDYKDELMFYYKEIKEGTFSKTEARYRIENLTTPYNNSINEKVTNIKWAFVSHFNEKIAENYFITGGRTEQRKITLPRELVTWDR